MVRTLFISSPYWSEVAIVGVNYLAVPYLANVLQNVGLIEIGDRTDHDAILGFYHHVTREQTTPG